MILPGRWGLRRRVVSSDPTHRQLWSLSDIVYHRFASVPPSAVTPLRFFKAAGLGASRKLMVLRSALSVPKPRLGWRQSCFVWSASRNQAVHEP